METNITSLDKRNSVKKNYDLIAKQYSRDFGIFIEDLDVYEEFEKYIPKKCYNFRFGCWLWKNIFLL